MVLFGHRISTDNLKSGGTHTRFGPMLLLSLMFFASASYGQSLKENQIYIASGCGLWTLANYTIQFSTPKLSAGNTWQVPVLDNYYKTVLRTDLKTISDFTLAGCLAFSAMASRSEIKTNFHRNISALIASTWVSVNLAHSVKMMVARNRPYASVAGYTPVKRDDRYSFFSGHTTMASAAFATALLNRDKLKKSGAWLVPAGLLGISTATLRILSGKHYPSDVITGALSGIGIALIMHKIHEI